MGLFNKVCMRSASKPACGRPHSSAATVAVPSVAGNVVRMNDRLEIASCRCTAHCISTQPATLPSATPAERRLMLEEAAGIAGLHVRRRDADISYFNTQVPAVIGGRVARHELHVELLVRVVDDAQLLVAQQEQVGLERGVGVLCALHDGEGVGVELGGYVSFSGILTFPKSEDIREIASEIKEIFGMARSTF